jgi:hypothetical protein
MIGSRFRQDNPLTIERLKDFVGLDNLTAQMPLIEVSRTGVVRFWVAYDISRTFGTYTEVDKKGGVKTVTVYRSGRKYEIVNRPPYENTRVRKAAKPHSAVPKAKRFKGLYEGKKHARAKRQRHAGDHVAQVNHRGRRIATGIPDEE